MANFVVFVFDFLFSASSARSVVKKLFWNDAEVFDVQKMPPALFFKDRFHPGTNLDLFVICFFQKVREGAVCSIELDVPIAVRNWTLFACVWVNKGEHQYREGGKSPFRREFYPVGHFHEALTAYAAGRNVNPAARGTSDSEYLLMVS